MIDRAFDLQRTVFCNSLESNNSVFQGEELAFARSVKIQKILIKIKIDHGPLFSLSYSQTNSENHIFSRLDTNSKRSLSQLMALSHFDMLPQPCSLCSRPLEHRLQPC